MSCADKEDGLYIDSSSYCKRYFECKSKNITEFICPDGTIYNSRHHRCTRSSTTRCPGSDTAQCAGIPDGYYPDYAASCKVFGLCMNGGLKTYNCPAGTFFDSKSLTCESDARCPKPDMEMCTGKYNGIYPVMESGCRDFYLCLDGLLTHKGSCPQGKLLNPLTGNCQPSSQVTCSPVIDPDCNMHPDGIYPDYDTGCSAYFVCLGERRIATTYCPGNQLYDISTRKCLPSSFVVCREKSFISPPRLLDTYNCDNRLGLYPEFSSDCQRFMLCAYGHKKYLNCSEGSHFDADANVCKIQDKKCKAPFAVATFQCLPGDDGIYVDINCSKWHECRNGIGFTNICPKKMYYNIKLGKCVESNNFCSSQEKIKQRTLGDETSIPIIVENSKFDCRNKEDGLYSDPYSCKLFHFCVKEKVFTYSCQRNFSFDNDKLMCLKSSNSEQCSSSRSRNIDIRQLYFSCEELEDGMYSDFSSNCRRYFVCENRNLIPVYCPDGQKFNSVKMMCDKAENVRCLPLGVNTEDGRRIKYARKNDDLFHVYGPDELYSETYEEIEKNRTTTVSPYSPDTDWDEYDDRSFLGKNIQHSDRYETTQVQNARNSIQNEPATKRAYATKIYTTPIPTYTVKYTTTSQPPDEATMYMDVAKEKTVKLYQIRYSNDFDAACRKGDTGFFPDYESGCKMFHICFRTIRKTYSCPSVLLFNPETKNCDLPENVVCTRPEPMLGQTLYCKEKMNQYIADFDSACRSYIGCINNLPYRFTCPKGKLFSQKTSICESENSFQCEYPEDYNITELIVSDEQVERFPVYRHVHGIPGQFYFSCSEKPDGFYPDYTRHCHVFYRCIKGKKFSHYCKQGLLFNPNSGICDFEENVECKPDNSTALV